LAACAGGLASTSGPAGRRDEGAVIIAPMPAASGDPPQPWRVTHVVRVRVADRRAEFHVDRAPVNHTHGAVVARGAGLEREEVTASGTVIRPSR